MTASDQQFTPISEIGEFGLIDRLHALLGPAAQDDVRAGIGDDTAVVYRGEGRVELITTDALIEGVHFDRTYHPLVHLGFKAMAVNVSDIAAMNGRPRYAVVALGLPNNMSVEMTEALYAGMKRACDAYQVRLVGGDTTASRSLVMAVTMIGEADEADVCYRKGAVPGDVLCVTGELGSAYAGLKVLLDRKAAFEAEGEDFSPNLEAFAHCVERHLMPQARLDVVREFARAGVKPHALIDISDGLASEVHHLCEQGRCGALIAGGKLPVHRETVAAAEQFGEEPGAYALFGGEDYELLFAIPPSEVDRITGVPIYVVGEVVEQEAGVHIELPGGERVALQARGFSHF